MSITPIETEYRGCRFRSRLEARWAVFFDSLGIEWKYELQGFNINRYDHDYCENNAEGPCESECVCPKTEYDWRWLPDFYLPVEMCWVEVKGDMGRFDAEMFTHMIDWGGQIPYVSESHGTTKGVIVLGDIPQPPSQSGEHRYEHEVVCHPIIQHYKGVVINGIAFGLGAYEKPEHESQPTLGTGYVKKKLEVIDHDFEGWENGDSSIDQVIGVGYTSITKPIGHWQWTRPVFSGCELWKASEAQEKAYRAARSARFEFGECG